MPTADLRHGDCLDILRQLPDESVHAVITDPPYGLANTDSNHVVETLSRWFAGERDYLPSGAGFMGKAWDAFVPPPAVWDECFRVLKPGGHLLCFAGTRTVDLMGLSIRLAGFDLRDTITWIYGSGFPKSLDVGKAIDKANGNPLAFREFARAYAATVAASPLTHSDIDRHLGIKSSSCYWAREDRRGGMPPRHHWEGARELLGLDASFELLYQEAERADREVRPGDTSGSLSSPSVRVISAGTPVTPEAQQWHGWGTALKPASEPIVVARKPLTGTVAANVLAHGTGALNIAATRVTTSRGDAGSNRGGSTSCTCLAPAVSRTTHTLSTMPQASSDASREGRSDLPASVGAGAPGSTAPQDSPIGCLSSLRSGDERAPKSQEIGQGAVPSSVGADGLPDLRARESRIRESRSMPCPQHTATNVETAGRWPANVVMDGDAADALDEQSGERPGGHFPAARTPNAIYGGGQGTSTVQAGGARAMGDTGGASRFFPVFRYQAKAPSRERPSVDGAAHPTVKPLVLMQWLVRLVTPPGGTVLEPFAGSGTTVEAALLEGFDVIGIEREADYLPLIQQRIDRVAAATTPISQPGVDGLW